MDMDHDELQYCGRSPESVAVSLDVKLAFNRLCILIDSLKDDIGPEAASDLMLRIRNDVTKVLKRKKERGLLKENGFCHDNGINTTSVSTSTYKVARKPATEDKDGSSYNCLQVNNGNSSFYKNQEKLFTSFSSSFRPVVCNNIKDLNSNVELGTIMEEKIFEINDDTDNGSEGQEDEGSDSNCNYFFLKSWSILRKDNELLLTGIKMDKNGEFIEKDFVSKKIICKKNKDTVRTLDGEFVLQGPLLDTKKIIPDEVKNRFLEEGVFPRFWRKALELWIDLDKKKLKEQKARKRSKSPKKKTSLDKLKSSNLQGLEKLSLTKKGELLDKINSVEKDKSLKLKIQKKGKSPSTKLLKENESSEKNKNKRHNENPQSKRNAMKDITESLNPSNNKRTKKNKEVYEPVQKRNKKGCSNDQNKHGQSKKQDEGPDDVGPFSELLGDESLFVLPKSSLTPNGLLGSIKKTVIKGRYTPPTTMFDNVYGNKSDNNSSINTSFEEIGVKNNHVVKRMCKVNTKTNPRKNMKSPKQFIEDEAINEILRAAKAKTNTTPSIMKEVFSAERAEDSVNFSDLSDIDDD